MPAPTPLLIPTEIVRSNSRISPRLIDPSPKKVDSGFAAANLAKKQERLKAQFMKEALKRQKRFSNFKYLLPAVLLLGILMFMFQLSLPVSHTLAEERHYLVDDTRFAFRFLRRVRQVDATEVTLKEQPKLAPHFAKIEEKFKRSHVKTGADVEGANMDHNGSVSNPCLTDRSLLRRAILEDPASSFQPAGLSYFVLVNGHRVDARNFAVVGISPVLLRDPQKFKKCMWIGHDNAVITGDLVPVYPGEHHDLMYETVILHCNLDAETVLHVGGALLVTIEGETFEAYAENMPRAQLYPGPEFRYNIGFCSFPIYREVVPERIAEWIQYSYHELGVDYFILNDGGSIDDEAYKILKPLVAREILEINDIRGAYRYESKHNVLFLNDCIYRMRWISKWSLVLDFDEYLYIPKPNSLPSLLEKYKDKPWLTFGSMWWGVDLCRFVEDRNAWPVEKMQFHWPSYYCVAKSRGFTEYNCINYQGHRKYIINPRKVSTVEVHRPVEPIDGGVNLNASTAWINHYQGLLRPTIKPCQEMVNAGRYPDWWIEDDYISSRVEHARKAGLPTKSIFRS